MALMSFREPNQVKWVGVLPGHNGEQVTAVGTANNNTSIIYTVPVGRTLYLCAVSISSNHAGAGSGSVWLETAGAVLVYGFCSLLNVAGGGGSGGSAPFYPPMEVSSGHVFKVNSTIAGLNIYGSIFGWIE